MHTTQQNRLTVQAAIQRHREELEIDRINRGFKRLEKARANWLEDQNRLDKIFDQINADNRKRPDTIRAEKAIDAAYVPVAEDPITARMITLETGWGWFFTAAILVGVALAAGLGLHVGVM